MTIHIIQGEFNKELELQLANAIKAGFPSPAEDYQHDTLDFNRDLIKHPEATFYGRVDGDSMIEAGINDGDIAIIDRSVSEASFISTLLSFTYSPAAKTFLGPIPSNVPSAIKYFTSRPFILLYF